MTQLLRVATSVFYSTGAGHSVSSPLKGLLKKGPRVRKPSIRKLPTHSLPTSNTLFPRSSKMVRPLITSVRHFCARALGLVSESPFLPDFLSTTSDHASQDPTFVESPHYPLSLSSDDLDDQLNGEEEELGTTVPPYASPGATPSADILVSIPCPAPTGLFNNCANWHCIHDADLDDPLISSCYTTSLENTMHVVSAYNLLEPCTVLPVDKMFSFAACATLLLKFLSHYKDQIEEQYMRHAVSRPAPDGSVSPPDADVLVTCPRLDALC
ncbi:hypothetical protein BD309DRAFT_984601 [Dichomitus squalens]|nr:hypothetical protein BD309DRAFT_984601 [Dichomitus squalens]